MKKILISLLVAVFALSGIPVYAAEVLDLPEEVVGVSLIADSTSASVSVSVSAVKKAKKKIDCKKKKNKKKKECKKPKKAKKINNTAIEGQMIEGKSGENKFKEPTGNGKYRFQIQTEWENPNACDAGRTLIGSKGKTWEDAWYKAYDIGKEEGMKPVPYYDETPQGSKAGTELYDEGYRLGYARGFDGLSAWGAQYDCKSNKKNLADFDNDGWYKLKGMPGLKALFLPFGYAGKATGSSLLGKDGVYVSFEDASQGALNNGVAPLNFTRADFLVTDLDASEQEMSMQDLVMATHDVMVAEAGKKYKSVCTFDEPLIEEKTYGSNTFVNLNWVTVCNTGADGGPSWMLNIYSFKKLADDKMLIVQLFSPQSVKASGKNELDTAKFPSSDFIEQLYSKMQF